MHKPPSAAAIASDRAYARAAVAALLDQLLMALQRELDCSSPVATRCPWPVGVAVEDGGALLKLQVLSVGDRVRVDLNPSGQLRHGLVPRTVSRAAVALKVDGARLSEPQQPTRGGGRVETVAT